MVRENAFLAVLFADIARSTRLYEILGDRLAKEIIHACLSALSAVAEDNRGRVVKTIGDAVMCLFESPDDAVIAATLMHPAVDRIPFDNTSEAGPPNIYVGIHYGPVILEDGDAFGDAVNVASRMADMAQQRQILTTEAVIKAISAPWRALTRFSDTTKVKGKQEQVRVFEVVWEQQEATVVARTRPASQKEGGARLTLSHGDDTVAVDQDRPAVTIGRLSHNDIVVDHHLVSRSHARIELRPGRFVIQDTSSNGTFVSVTGLGDFTVHRDEAVLTGEGFISPGRKADAASEGVIRFRITSGRDGDA